MAAQAQAGGEIRRPVAHPELGLDPGLRDNASLAAADSRAPLRGAAPVVTISRVDARPSRAHVHGQRSTRNQTNSAPTFSHGVGERTHVLSVLTLAVLEFVLVKSA